MDRAPFIIVRAKSDLPVMFFDRAVTLDEIATEASYLARRDQRQVSVYDVRNGSPVCTFYTNGNSNGDPREAFTVIGAGFVDSC